MEEAANELINMLMEFDHSQKEEKKVEEESSTEKKTIDPLNAEGCILCGMFEIPHQAM